MPFVSVAVPVPSLDALTYRVPEGAAVPEVGTRVLVPLGARTVTGCVIDAAPAGVAAEDLKPLTEVLDDAPFLPAHVVALARWTAEYYACGVGEALAAAMPPGAWIESERRWRLTDAGRHALGRLKPAPTGEVIEARGPAGEAREGAGDAQGGPGRMLVGAGNAPGGADQMLVGAGFSRPDKPGGFSRPDRRPSPDLDDDARAALAAVARAKRLTGAEVQAFAAVLRRLERDGLVERVQELRGRSSAFKTRRLVAITAAGLEAVAGDTGLGAKPRELLEALGGAPDGVSASGLAARGLGADTVARLVKKGYVAVRRVREERDPFTADGGAAGPDVVPVPDRQLTGEQSAALARLGALLDEAAFRVALLHGVTGSGKTELYVRIAARACARGRRVLVLVPEIALTPAIAAIFRGAFGSRVAIQHSGLSDGERHDQWHRVRRGEVDIVVGTRSAVFAPLDNVGLVIVDEEHDTSYKQEESPRYHGRDVAVVRGRHARALVVLGSATPSLESWQNAATGRYERITLTRRVLDRPLASVSVVNMRTEYADDGPGVIVSRELGAALDERLAAGEQSLVLLNRRGYATALLCRQCGGSVDCPNCSVSLTVHGAGAGWRARCHYCNYSARVPKTCPTCAAPYMEQIGFGTQKVESEIARLCPSARLARVDRDTVRRRGAIGALLARFGRGEIDVLVGTQMIAKGHDFPQVTLVGVISADVGLGLADFRAGERTFQLLTQVAGRAGRGEKRGQAIIQTVHPEHYSIQLACRQDYDAFVEQEMQFRRAMRYPPLVGMINTIVRGRSHGDAMEAATDLVRALAPSAVAAGFSILGPAPAPLSRLRGEHRVQFFLKGTHRPDMRAAVQAVVAGRPDLRRRVTIDVDPLNVL